MLSFEEKKDIFHLFYLEEKKMSNGRVNFVYPKSKQKGQVLATQLHSSGNGYVIGKYMPSETIKNNRYKVDQRGWISIKNFSKEELITVISHALESMGGDQDVIKRYPANEATSQLPSKQEYHESTAFEMYPGSCLFAWLGLTLSTVEFGYLFWKKTWKKYGVSSL